MASRKQETKRDETEDGNSPTHDAFAVVHYRVQTEDGKAEVKERLAELGPCWPTQNGHMKLRMYTTPLEWNSPNCHERVIVIVRRKD